MIYLTDVELGFILELMPYRYIPFSIGEIYHVYNRSVGKLPIFITIQDYFRAYETLDYYRFMKVPMRFSYFKRQVQYTKNAILDGLISNNKSMVTILAFALMPNHFHLVLVQKKKDGISELLRNFQNSYAKYFNTKRKRTGALFQSMFKSKRVNKDEQLMHLVRYVHLNPLTSRVIEKHEELENYPWNSFTDYMGKRTYSFVEKEMMRNYFKSIHSLKKFTFDQADYQRNLDEIKHLMIE